MLSPKRLRNWLRGFIMDYFHEDRYIESIIGRSDEAPWSPGCEEYDRATIFWETVQNLSAMLGSEKDAAAWLAHNPQFGEAEFGDPIDFLENGSVDALIFMCAVTSVARANGGFLVRAQ